MTHLITTTFALLINNMVNTLLHTQRHCDHFIPTASSFTTL
jgi:hypothetical protein